MEFRILAMIAALVDFCSGGKERRRSRPLAATIREPATLRRFLREGTPWRGLRASAKQASGPTLRRSRCMPCWFACCAVATPT
jgi:hypothetical protein